MSTKKEIDVKVSTIQLIANTTRPVTNRLESILRDYYSGQLKLSESEHVLLMEMASASTTLTCLLGEYLSQAEEHSATAVTLPNPEFKVILQLAKTVELVQRTSIGQVAMWVN
jgi:hypothetical protein